VTRWRKYIVAVVVVLFLIMLAVWSPWSKFLYRGDGEFSDNLFLYPRYQVRFPDISLSEAGEHHFRLAGLPYEELGLVLIVKDDKAGDRIALTQFPATIEAKLVDDRGNEVCQAVGRPANENRDGVWVLMSGPGVSGYWHYQCNSIRVSMLRQYDFMIRVSNVGENAPRLVVTPTLRGGGVELP
jgi:hypothetical protein